MTRAAILVVTFLLAASPVFAGARDPVAPPSTVYLASPAGGDLHAVLADNGLEVRRFDTAADAIAAAPKESAVYANAENQLAQFLCRIQVRSEVRPELDGAWFRAFDFRRWEHWASNADAGWGAWCVETGWTQGWIVAVLALRELNTSLWDLTGGIKLNEALESHRGMMFPDHD